MRAYTTGMARSKVRGVSTLAFDAALVYYGRIIGRIIRPHQEK